MELDSREFTECPVESSEVFVNEDIVMNPTG
jgi:hypothetical protein